MKGKRLLILGAAFALGLSACANSATLVRKSPLNAAGGTPTGTWAPINSVNDISEDEDFLLGYISSGTEYYSKSTALSSKALQTSSSLSNAKIVRFVSVNGGWNIQIAESNYLGYDSSTNLAENSTPGTSNKYIWSANLHSSGDVYFTNNNSGRFLGAASTNANANIKAYASSNLNSGSYPRVTAFKASTKTLTTIVVSDNSGKTWRANDTVLASDLKIVATYSDNSTRTIVDGAGVTILSGNPLVAGSNTIQVSYNDGTTTKTDTVAITALAAISLNSISITTAPSKTAYYVGEFFDSAGIVITATFSDNSTVDVTNDCVFVPDGALTVEVEEIAISYSFKGVTKSVNQAITVTNDSADEVTFTANVDLGQTNGSGTPDSLGKLGYVVNGTNAAFATAQYRVYANSEITFSIISGEIGKITLTGSDKDNPISNLSLKAGQSGTFEDGVWTGKAQSVTLVAGKQARIDSIVIEKATNDPLLTVDVSSIELKTNEMSGKQVVATVFNVDNPTFVWTPNSNAVTVDVISTLNGVQTVAIKPNTETAEEVTVSLTISGTDLNSLISVSITVPGPGETAETAYSVAQARAAIDAGQGVTGVFATGIVSKIVTAYSSQYGNISYDISTDGTTESDQLRAYRGKGINGANFTSADDIEVGATVVVYGNLTKYNDVYEFAEGNQLVSIVRPSHGVDYYLDRGSSFAELHGHENKTIEQQATVSKTIAEIAEDQNYTISTSGSEVCYTSLDLDNNINVSTNGSPNCGSIWGTTNSDWRLYHNKGGDVVITASNGFRLSSATFTFTNKNNGILTLNGTTVSSGSPVVLNGTEATFDVGNSNSATDGQIKITAISVSYEKSTFESVDSIQLKFGASISENDWNAIINDSSLEVQEYGVKLFTSSSSTFSSEKPVQDAITGGKTPKTVSKAYTEALEIENRLMTFTITINIQADSAYGVIFCAAPFVRVSGHDYFFPEIQGSVNSVANDCLTNNDYSLLSREALLVLAGN